MNNLNIIEFPKRDFVSKIKFNEIRLQIINNFIPNSISHDYINLFSLTDINSNGTLMVLPYSIEIK